MLKINRCNNKKNKISLYSLVKFKIYLGTSNKLWDPKMAQYLFGIRNGFCVFKLKKTLACLRKAMRIVSKINFSKKKILFIGFPASEKSVLVPLFLYTGNSFTNDQFWFNGVLTNGKHFNICVNIFKEIALLKGKSDQLVFFNKFGGASFLKKTPNLVIIYNHSGSLEALKEASKMGIPIISFVNSDSSPEQSDYPIPGNFLLKSAGKFYSEIIKVFLNIK
jgi:small subunit ribosomal protein S2